MIETVFISDLHLHPDEPAIQQRFEDFLLWVREQSVKNLYILGDFFYAWAGDDAMDAWSRGIAAQLHTLKQEGINLFYMQGNRDFLLGKPFAKLAGWQVLSEPTVIKLGEESVLLVHGDRYCTLDKAHQRFRSLTRNPLFSYLFQKLPLSYRLSLVDKVREKSLSRQKSAVMMDVVEAEVIAHMKQHQVFLMVHGHTHKPASHCYQVGSQEFKRYVLSDWDDIPQLLCYDKSKGLYFNRI